MRTVAICNIFVAVSIASLCLTAGEARADYLAGNPKHCTIGTQTQPAAYCAKRAAQLTFKAFMARKTGQAWDADITCAATRGLIRWRCTWKQADTHGAGTVWFRATATGWHRIVTANG